MTDTSVLEIVELDDGRFVLRSADGEEGEPLASISFSSQTLEMLRHHRFDVAREMLDHLIERSLLGNDGDREESVPAAIH
ncbi:hypothetical protein [Kushneria aurantia]|uniref:Uncharacterized protein n=1 Tax=Kushneria aurantia TaxID=504092 RepID=A0ABV6G6R3_9GAMM|nr:hypothetical protein [Kushneria aurantia]